MTIGADGVVVVGGGQAGYQAARSLRDEGYDGKIRLVSAEPYFPYQRPPLSKEYLTDAMAPERLAFSTEDIFQVAAIDLIRGVAVEELDLDGRKVRLTGGSELAYGHLILATGARNRELSYLARDDVVMLRDLADATDIRHRLGNAERIIIVGAGFLGLEIASAARSMGRDVDVIELHEMPLNRGVSRPAAEALVAAHRAAGVRFYLRRYVKSIERAGASARHVELDDGTRLTGDLIVVSIGVTPNTELAAAAGLAVSNGIIVDGALRTADPHISAIGDCCAFPSAQANGYIRLESVQNAIEQARFVASSLLQGPALYNVVPWFWSDQAGQRLQMAGLNTSHDDAIVVRKLDEPGLSVYCFRQGRLIGVDSINRPGDHMAARRMFASGRLPSRGMITARAFDLKAWSKQATA